MTLPYSRFSIMTTRMCGRTMNGVGEVAVPPGVVTLITPVVAPAGTEVLMWESSVTLTVAALPLNVTAVAPVNPVPVITTDVPTDPLVGLKPVIVGTGGAVVT